MAPKFPPKGQPKSKKNSARNPSPSQRSPDQAGGAASLRKAPQTPPKKPVDQTPLLEAEAPRSDSLSAAPITAETSPPPAKPPATADDASSPTSVTTTDHLESGKKGFFHRWALPMFAILLIVVLITVDGAATATGAFITTAYDKILPIILLDIDYITGPGTAEAFYAWFIASETQPESCPAGLVVDGPEVTPASTAYTLGMLFWCFYGVSIGADLFMEAIETITSAETTTHVALPGGQKRSLTVHVWNGTVANLTLMALGSSAPEILLSVIEICGNSFYSGELGPSTIVGSAAFNLMVISAVCVTALPEGEGRYIREQSVFVITAFFSVFAYLWLLVILVYVTPNIIDVWEGLTTLALFPFLTYLAYAADIGAIGGSSKLTAGGGLVAPESAGLMGASGRQVAILGTASQIEGVQRRSAAYYRMNATKGMEGGLEHAQSRKLGRAKSGLAAGSLKLSTENRKGSYLAKTSAHNERVKASARAHNHGSAVATVELGSTYFSARDTDGFAFVQIFRSGNVTSTASVGYEVCLADGADGGAGTLETRGRVSFGHGQQSSMMRIQLLPSDVARAMDSTLKTHPAFIVTLKSPSDDAAIGGRSSCAVRVVNADAPGVLCPSSDTFRVREDASFVEIILKREDGSHGEVSCVVSTKDGSAVAPADYDAIDNEPVHFADGQTFASIRVTIHADDHFEGDESFSIIFSEVTGGASFSAMCDGGPERALSTVVIECDDDANAAGFDGLLVKCGINADLWSLIALDYWNQFEDALAFDSSCTFSHLIFYVLAVPWRLAFALAPPTRLAGGWACFIVALGMIGGLTALVGDYAGNLGCCLGISKSVTAITFVALGTSLPDTFASMKAAIEEPHADNSLGNITGSNSVNVFLGLGLPWGIAAVYWALTGTGANEAAWRARYSNEQWYDPSMPVAFAVPAGSLGYSVTVFSCCAVVTLATLFLRRAVLGFELGGNPLLAKLTAVFFVGLWFVYIVLSIIRDGA